MKHIFFSLICVWCVFPAWSAAYTTQERLQEASDLYFQYHQPEALDKYVQLSKDTGDRSAFLNAVFIAMEQNKPKEAVDNALEAYRLYPQDSEVLEMAAEALLADGQYAAAERILSFLPQDNNTAGFFHINLARAQLGLHENKLAKYNLKQAVKAGSHPGLAHFLLGTVYEGEQKYKDAAKAYEAAVDYDHQFAEARVRWARMLELSKQYEAAYKQYRIILASDKKNTQAAQALARLKAHITKPEKELSPQPAFAEHTDVQPLVLPAGMDNPVEIKIGLGVLQNGKPAPRSQVTFSVSHDFIVNNSQDKQLALGHAGETWQAVLENKHSYLVAPDGKKTAFKKLITVVPSSDNPTQAATIIVKHLMSGAGMSWASVGDKEYRGKLQILHADNHNLVPINVVTLDEYVQGIIASEMPAGFPQEALRAQAVLARTYALKHRGKHKY